MLRAVLMLLMLLLAIPLVAAGPVGVAATGRARGDKVAVGVEEARCFTNGCVAVGLLGDAFGDVVVSGAGDAQGVVAVSMLGDASGSVAFVSVSRCLVPGREVCGDVLGWPVWSIPHLGPPSPPTPPTTGEIAGLAETMIGVVLWALASPFDAAGVAVSSCQQASADCTSRTAFVVRCVDAPTLCGVSYAPRPADCLAAQPTCPGTLAVVAAQCVDVVACAAWFGLTPLNCDALAPVGPVLEAAGRTDAFGVINAALADRYCILTDAADDRLDDAIEVIDAVVAFADYGPLVDWAWDLVPKPCDAPPGGVVWCIIPGL